MGGLVRCDGCGGLQWSPLHAVAAGPLPACEICGEPLKLERRRPGRRYANLTRERRNLLAPVRAPAKPPGRPVVQP